MVWEEIPANSPDRLLMSDDSRAAVGKFLPSVIDLNNCLSAAAAVILQGISDSRAWALADIAEVFRSLVTYWRA
jgi:hypothetical protein